MSRQICCHTVIVQNPWHGTALNVLFVIDLAAQFGLSYSAQVKGHSNREHVLLVGD